MTENSEVGGEHVDGQVLEKAEEHLTAALSELTRAQQDVQRAEMEIQSAIDHEKQHFHVSVLYDGIKKKFEVRMHEHVKHLLEQAITAFGPLTNSHMLALFSPSGQELNDSLTIKDAGITPHEELLLRPSTVRGGS